MQNMRSALYSLVVGMLVLCVSGCGFYLRGTHGNADFSFRSIFIELPDTSTLGNTIRRTIRSNNKTQIAPDRDSAEVVMQVLSESKDKSVLSLNSQGRVREYTLHYQLNFRVVDAQGNELLEPTEIVLNRTIGYSDSQVLAKEAEEVLLYRDMQADMVQRVVQYLALVKCCDYE